MSKPTTQAQHLTDIQRTRLEQIANRFSAAWKSSRHKSADIYLSSFLPPAEDRIFMNALYQLIQADLEFRLQRGEGLLLEKYLEEFSELGGADALPVDLIAAEFQLRSRYGAPPKKDEYRNRFPKQFPALEPLLHFDGTASRPDDAGPRATMMLSGPLRSSRKVVAGGDGYHLLECIGSGVFGEVWRAEAPGGVEVAVKIIHWTSSHKLTEVELRALELIKRLRHPFLMQVQAYWLANDQLYIVMDLADGTLDDRFEECRKQGLPGIPADELQLYMREAAEALDYLHREQVLHRDVKPANILLVNGHARMADFGLARLVTPADSDVRATTVGTPLYMGPEVWERRVSPASDQYSLAATYVEMRLGHPIFSADNQADVMRDHMSGTVDLHELSRAEQRVLHRALAKRATDRYPTCAEFVQDLDDAMNGGKKKPGGSLVARILTMLLLPVLIGLASFAAWQRYFPPSELDITAPPLVEIRAGEEDTFEIHITGASTGEGLKPTFSNVPSGLTLTTRASGEESADASAAGVPRVWRIDAAAELNLPEESFGKVFDVTAEANDGTRQVQRTIQLRIEEPKMVVPPHCVPARGAVRRRVPADKANYWSRIVRLLPGDIKLPSEKTCEFVLVPHQEEAKLAGFYIMENKVWNELFTVFNERHTQDRPPEGAAGDWPNDWRERGAAQGAEDMPADSYPLHPVMSVNFEQATSFAAWLGGKLPTPQQWDAAAGRLQADGSPGKGPFKGVWNDIAERPEIAVLRADTGPLPVGSARDDVSPFGCRDMAGNGAEWTRDISEGQFATVGLRGRRYDKQRPLLYEDLRDVENQSQFEREDPNAVSPYIGFRVVLEP